jgi:Uma2 family endonuclease
MSAVAATPMTTEQLLALPRDGVDRWLIRGQLREKPMTVRNRWHSLILINIGYWLKAWLRQQPQPRGQILGGEAGCRLLRSPDSTVGIDLVYISAEIAAQRSDKTSLIEGAPVLAVEILSPSDAEQEINEKVDTYLAAGVRLVWIVDPHDRTVLVYRPGAEPVLFNARQELSGDPELPGFRVAVSEFFAE